MDLYRSHPTYTSGVPVNPDSYRALSKPKEIWHLISEIHPRRAIKSLSILSLLKTGHSTPFCFGSN